MQIKVTIPVTIGGYTGQGDKWEEIQREHDVTLVEEDGPVRTLYLQDNTTPLRRQIRFDPDELQSAIDFLKKHNSENEKKE